MIYTTRPMPAALRRYITVNDNILGGTPVISGTRIPVTRLTDLLRQGYTTKTLEEEFPHVEPKKIQILMAYLLEFGLDALKSHKEKR